MVSVSMNFTCLVHKESQCKLGVVVYACNPILGRQRQKDCNFKDSLDYTVSFRPAWITQQDPISYLKTKQQPKKDSQCRLLLTPNKTRAIQFVKAVQ
jgi:hypothetical protein